MFSPIRPARIVAELIQAEEFIRGEKKEITRLMYQLSILTEVQDMPCSW